MSLQALPSANGPHTIVHHPSTSSDLNSLASSHISHETTATPDLNHIRPMSLEDLKEQYRNAAQEHGPNSPQTKWLERAICLKPSICQNPMTGERYILIESDSNLLGGAGGKQDPILFLKKMKARCSLNSPLQMSYQNAMQLGCGINADGSLKSKLIKLDSKDIETDPHNAAPSTTVNITIFNSRSSMAKKTARHGQGGLDVICLEASGAYNDIDRMEACETHQYLAIEHHALTGRCERVPTSLQPLLAEGVLKAIEEKGLQAFFDTFGTHFIDSYRYAMSFYGQFEVVGQSAEEATAMIGQAQGQCGNIWAGNVEGNYRNGGLKGGFAGKSRVSYTTNGCTISTFPSSNFSDLETAMKEYTQALKNTPQGAPVIVSCAPWITLPGIQRNKKLIDEFIELTQNYQKQLEKDFLEFITNAIKLQCYKDAALVFCDALNPVQHKVLLDNLFSEGEDSLKTQVDRFVHFIDEVQIMHKANGTGAANSLLQEGVSHILKARQSPDVLQNIVPRSANRPASSSATVEQNAALEHHHRVEQLNSNNNSSPVSATSPGLTQAAREELCSDPSYSDQTLEEMDPQRAGIIENFAYLALHHTDLVKDTGILEVKENKILRDIVDTDALMDQIERLRPGKGAEIFSKLYCNEGKTKRYTAMCRARPQHLAQELQLDPYYVQVFEELKNCGIEISTIADLLLRLGQQQPTGPHAFHRVLSATPWAAEFIAESYETGKGRLQQNRKKAFQYYQKAACCSTGRPSANYHLGRCYQEGIGVKKDPKIAFNLFVESSKNGNIDATTKLGECYLLGTGTTKSLERAKALFEEVLRKRSDDASAHYFLAICLEESGYTPFGPHKRLAVGGERTYYYAECYRQAARHGVRDASYRLALFYESDSGYQDYAKALQHLNDASELGHIRATAKRLLYFKSREGTKYNVKNVCGLRQVAAKIFGLFW